MKIILSGLDGIHEHKRIKAAAAIYDVEFYPSYYDHELKGDRDAIEALTVDLWGMKSDEWADNGLTETTI